MDDVDDESGGNKISVGPQQVERYACGPEVNGLIIGQGILTKAFQSLPKSCKNRTWNIAFPVDRLHRFKNVRMRQYRYH